VFAVVASLAAVAFYVSFARLETGAIDGSLDAQAQALAAGIDSSNGRITFQGGDSLPGQTSTGIAVDALLVDANSAVLDRSGHAPPLSVVSSTVHAALATDQPVVTSLTAGGATERVRAQRFASGNGQDVVLVVSRSTTEEDNTLHRTAFLLIGVVGLLTAVASVLGYVVAGRALRPVRVIAATARDISERDLHRRIVLDLPPDELGELAATFNAMLDRLESGFGVLQRFTADAAHELRAPLAVMLADVDVSLRQPRSTDEYRATIDGIGTEIERLGRLADQLLVLARADAGALVPRFESIDLPDFLEEAVARWRPLIEKRGLRVTTALPDVGTIDADGELIRRVIDNLLDNAAKYTPAGGAISVGATHENGWWRIEVADTGPGIPDAVRDIVFERFSRGDPARARDSGGAGLGLALCAAIAQAHGGSITLGDGRGARMTVTLPASHR
jgi:heavy metal sensor kinase